VTWDRSTAEVFTYDFGFEQTCGTTVYDGPGDPRELPAAAAAPLADSVQSGNGYFITELSDVLGFECDAADLLMSDPAWAPVAPVIAPAFIGLYMEGASGTDLGLRDFWLDSDADGVDEAWSAQVIATLYDAAFTPLCTIQYDVDNAVPVDPSLYTAFGLYGTPSVLYRAWSVTLADGVSDCTAVNPATFGTNDIQAHIASVPWTFGIGDMADMDDFLMPYAVDWASIEPTLYGFFASTDNVYAVEIGLGQAFDLDDCYVADPTFPAFDRSVPYAGWPALTTSYNPISGASSVLVFNLPL
jgi:hypothetical protein